MYKAKVITISDRGYKKERADLAGPAVQAVLIRAGYAVDEIVIVPDEEDMIIAALNDAIKNSYELIVTTGGTGFSKRDITPECTKKVIDREAPGIAEYMRYKSMQITPRAMLSRSVCGIKRNSLIINLPGSPKAAVENLDAVIDTLKHGLDMLLSVQADCANNSR